MVHSEEDLQPLVEESPRADQGDYRYNQDRDERDQEERLYHRGREEQREQVEEHNEVEEVEQERRNIGTSKIKSFFHALWNGPHVNKDATTHFFKRYFPRLEKLPYDLNKRIPKHYRISLLICYYLCWFGLCYSILVPYYLVPPALLSDPQSRAVALSCLDQVSWLGKNGACGLEGDLCGRTPPEGDIVFRCPALCDRSWTYSLMPIGDQRIKYRSYVIGGGSPKKAVDRADSNVLSLPYRADSYACASAVHAGVVSPFFGGCARISHSSGPRSRFNSTRGHYQTGNSILFDSFFKASYYFADLGNLYIQCTDPRLLILTINVVLGAPIVYLASGAVAYWTVGIVGFWTVLLATDPPRTTNAASPDEVAAMLLICFERFLPSCFILYVLWRVSTKRTLSAKWDSNSLSPDHPENEDADTVSIQSPLAKVFLWYPLFWLGALNNITFDRLPVDRLTLSDLQEQPGALISVLCIFSLILSCTFIQAYKIWALGRFRKYLIIYGLFLLALIVLSKLPGLTLRVHHYILAMLLIPGCSTRGNTALLFQGILLGLFLSGSARWGLALIVETALSLKRDDPSGIVYPPELIGYNVKSGILSWEALVEAGMTKVEKLFFQKYSAVSILVNDIEYFVEENLNSVNLTRVFEQSELGRFISDGLEKADSLNIYLRLGRKVPNTSQYGDFTNAAVLKWPSGDLKLPTLGLT